MDTTKKPEMETAFSLDHFSAFIRSLKLPDVNANDLASQKKNIEAFAKSLQASIEEAAAVARRQTEILRPDFDQTKAIIRDRTVAPAETVPRQAEFAKKASETAVANVRELADTIEKSNKEALEIIRRRTSETLDEIRKSILRKKVD